MIQLGSECVQNGAWVVKPGYTRKKDTLLRLEPRISELVLIVYANQSPKVIFEAFQISAFSAPTRYEQLLGGLDERTRRKLLERQIRCNKLKNYCVFCKNNGELGSLLNVVIALVFMYKHG